MNEHIQVVLKRDKGSLVFTGKIQELKKEMDKWLREDSREGLELKIHVYRNLRQRL